MDAKLVLRNVAQSLVKRLEAADRAAVLARVGAGAPHWVLGLLALGSPVAVA